MLERERLASERLSEDRRKWSSRETQLEKEYIEAEKKAAAAWRRWEGARVARLNKDQYYRDRDR